MIRAQSAAGVPWRTWANLVTLVRLVGAVVAAGLVVQAATGPDPVRTRLLLVAVSVGCLVLDGVDGRVARARGEASAFGARFDMEADAVLLLVLSVAVVALGVAGGWALFVAGLRYLYVLAALAVPALNRPLRPSLARKVVAVVQGVALCLALVLDLVVPGAWPSVVLGVALAALVWSFGRDVLAQLGLLHPG